MAQSKTTSNIQNFISSSWLFLCRNFLHSILYSKIQRLSHSLDLELYLQGEEHKTPLTPLWSGSSWIRKMGIKRSTLSAKCTYSYLHIPISAGSCLDLFLYPGHGRGTGTLRMYPRNNGKIWANLFSSFFNSGALAFSFFYPTYNKVKESACSFCIDFTITVKRKSVKKSLHETWRRWELMTLAHSMELSWDPWPSQLNLIRLGKREEDKNRTLISESKSGFGLARPFGCDKCGNSLRGQFHYIFSIACCQPCPTKRIEYGWE